MNIRLAALYGAWLMVCGTAAWAEPCQLEQMEMPVRVVEFRPVATLTVNGAPVPMLVDSGAFYSFLSDSVASELKLPTTRLPSGMSFEGYTGRVEARLTKVSKLGLLGVELQGVEFLVGGNELNAGIRGVLGRNILAMADTEYDLAHGVVRLSLPRGDCADTNFAHWAGSAPVVVVPLVQEHRDDRTIRMSVSVNGTRMLALLDTGAPSTALSSNAAARAGIGDADMTLVGRTGGFGAGSARVWTAPIKTFEVGGEKIVDNRLEVTDARGPSEGVLLGLDYFLSHRIYVARSQDKVYITWNGGPVFAQNSAAGTYDARYAALPPEVDKGDADALARRGAAAIVAGNYARAIEDLDRACELAPTASVYFFDRARAHIAMKQTLMALADLDTALGLDPSLSQARLTRSMLRRSSGDLAGWQTDLARLDADLPPSAGPRAAMAIAYEDEGRVAEALRQFELFLGSHPNDARTAGLLNSRCWMRARLNIEPAKALADCNESIDRDDADPAPHGSLGWAYLRLDDARRAKRSFDDSIRLKPTAYSHLGRGLAQLRMNDKVAAERDLEAARNLDPGIEARARKAGFEFVDVARAPAS